MAHGRDPLPGAVQDAGDVVSRLPEWFVGGPWHGRDKLVVCPNLQDMIRVVQQPEMRVSVFSADVRVSATPETDYFTYVRSRISLFGYIITVWVGQDDARRLNGLGNSVREHELSRLVGGLLLAPHKIEDGAGLPPNGGEYARAMERESRSYSDPWQRERAIRDEIMAEFSEEISRYRARIRDLEAENHRGSFEWIYRSETRAAGRIEVNTGEDWAGENFRNITVFLDEGTGSDQGPSWVATAQGTRGPVTGYGTTSRAAIVAMLADAIDVYARMIDTSEKPRMR